MKNLLFSLFAVAALTTFAQAQTSEPVVTSEVTAQLLSESTHLVPGETVDIGLFLDIKDHWHLYWTNPGDSGLPPEIEWDLPEGYSIGEIQWPAPEYIPTPPLATFGYEGELLLTAALTVPDNAPPGEPVILSASARWLVCKEVCLPGSADLSLQIPVRAEPATASPQAALFETARTSQPVEDHGIELSAELKSGSVTVSIPASALNDPESGLRFFPFSSDQYEHTAEQNLTAGDPVTLNLPLNLTSSEPKPAAVQGVLVSEGGWTDLDEHKAIAVEVNITSSPSSAVPGDENGSFGLLIFSAFIGGLILNLMPCVFPVLGLKIMGFVEQAGSDRKKIAAHGLWFTAGVVASFWVLAGILIAIRAGGAELGWGFQLQSPMFVFALCLLLFVFALNLSGVFEVGTTMTSVGGNIAEKKKGYTGSFISGTLATLVATPCAAPILAPAIGAALALPAAASMLVFTFVALGLSVPYLLFSLFPALIEKLPRPGAWMETFKQAMAFLLYGTVAYLVWVLLGQVDERGSQLILFSLVIAALAAWIYGRYATLSASGRKLWTARLATLLLLLISIQMGRTAATPTAIEWEKWSPERVEQLRDDRPVYVDFTARWCATCQVNKRVVFDSDKVIDAFQKMNIAPLKADWTNQDPEITRALESFGRSAVPFNLIYLPGRAEPIILPELLTPDIVVNALNSP